MNIIVCIKQVPNVSAMKIDPATRTLVREGVPLEVSAFDIRALLKAVDLAKETGGEVVALTMGPPQAAKALEHCLALGATRAIHLSDRSFAGADTLATARALAAAIRKEPFDLVFCGRYSVDAETGQVGPELAELLGLPQATAVRKIALSADRKTATVERETDEGYETLELPLPFVLTAAEDLAPERFPGKKDREAAKTKTVKTLTAADIGADPATIGQAGSPTWVKGVSTVSSKRSCERIAGDPAAQVAALVTKLKERGLYGTWKGESALPVLPPAGRKTRPDRAVWVVAESQAGRIRPVSFELLGKGAELASRLEGELVAVVIGRHAAAAAPALAAQGADTVLAVEDAQPYRTEPHAEVLVRAIRERKPHSVLIPSTSIGRDLAPRIAARLGLGLTGDCIGLEIDEQSNLVMLKPAFGGNIVAPVLSKTFPQMATVRPGMLRAARPDSARRAKVVTLEAATASRVRVVSTAPADGGADALDSAEVVVGFGMGIGGPEQLPVIRELAAVLGAPLATTRDVTDKGWLPRQHQVGLTGRAIAPRLYFAIGIRGAFEHTVGIQKAGIVVAINNDDQAWIWDSADLGIKGDWTAIVPLLTQALSAAKPR